jgi:integrase
MPKKIPELGPIQVRNLRHGVTKKGGGKKKIGDPCATYHAVGGVAGLILQCRPPGDCSEIGSRSWILRTMIGGARREIGLGGYPDVSLAEAREAARKLKADIRSTGVDPVAERKMQKAQLVAIQKKQITFKEIATDYFNIAIKEFEGKDPQDQINRLSAAIFNRCIPEIGGILISDLDTEHILQVLRPIWETKNPTAKRTRQTISRVWESARGRRLVTGDNPARWDGNLDAWLPAAKKIHKTKHRPAISYKELPDFIHFLLKRDTIPARALEFQILTVGRPGEIRDAEWSEIDLDELVWTIPGPKVKNRDDDQPHAVPLLPRAVEILRMMPKSGQYVFPGDRGAERVSENALNNTVKAIHKVAVKAGQSGFLDPQYRTIATAHGMRATFKNFSTAKTGFDDVVSELSLSHMDSDETRAAYFRDQILDRRRELLQVYGRYAYTGDLPRKEKYEYY